MYSKEMVEISLTNNVISWYKKKGYILPLEKVQLWATVKGKRIKNGMEERVIRGTKLLVKISDLPPSSNTILNLICETCKKNYTCSYKAFSKKISNNCVSCQAKKGFKGGCQDYWVDKLIVNNPDSKCDISGEKDKRFLELHHLLSRSAGGKNEESNFVVLSANYHRAFHKWIGGTNIPCYPEQYYKFKNQELCY
jgi:hypothetical protein